MTPSSSLRERVLAATSKTPSPPRNKARLRAIAAYAAAIALMLAVFFAMGGLGHARGRPLPITIGIAIGATVLATIATRAGIARGGSMLGRSSRVLAATIALVPVATYGWLVAWHGRYAEGAFKVGYRCLAISLVCASALLAVVVWVRARTVVRAPALHGAAMGAASGAWAAALVDVWCPLSSPSHVLVGHVLPVIVLVLAGALIGRSVLAIRSRAAREERP